MKDPNRIHAVFVAAHAVAETRLGPPYEIMGIAEGPQWAAPDRPLTWRNADEASDLLLRLAVGYAAVRRFTEADASTAEQLADEDLNGVAQVVEKQEGAARLSPNEIADRAAEIAKDFLDDAANVRAIEMIRDELLTRGRLEIHEVDLLVEAADGDPDALDGLQRYRAAFSNHWVPWPDET